METLSNFISIYCYISFVIGAVLMLVALAIAAMGKDDEPRNKVHFYVSCEKIDYRDEMVYTLWIGKTYYTEHRRFRSNVWGRSLAVNASFRLYNLNPADFSDMREGEIREVFLNLED